MEKGDGMNVASAPPPEYSEQADSYHASGFAVAQPPAVQPAFDPSGHNPGDWGPIPPDIASGFQGPPSVAMPMPPANPAPLAPTLSSGHEEVAPPSYAECTIQCPHSEEDVRSALVEYSQYECCFNKKLIQEMRIHEITPMHAFRYVLDTFAETRTLEEKCEPYKNQYVDGSQNGPPPNKWDVLARPQQSFAKSNVTVDLPHSASIMTCPNCHQTGFVSCTSCNGMGFARCTWCNGSGRKCDIHNNYENCSSCSGMGRTNCTWCQMGRKQCSKCKGHKFLKFWQSLKIKWYAESNVYETERGELKPKHLKKAKCEELLMTKKSTPHNPQPLKCPQDPKISLAASSLISQHLSSQNDTKRVLEFQQRIGIIPVVKVIYDYRGKDGHFYIYGRANLVYFPGGRPASGCCSIM